LQRFGLSREGLIQFGQLVILGRQRGRFFDILFLGLAQLGNLALQCLALRRKRLELFSVLLLDRV
jgi:hypothetical protein